MRSRTERAQLKEHELSKQRQQNKFARLAEKKTKAEEKLRQSRNNIASDCISKWVKNCSSRLLNDTELSVLAKGLNFAVTPEKVPVVEVITKTEVACKNLPESDANELRSKVAGLLSRPKKIESNLDKSEKEALKSLSKDKDIEILPADKGRLVVVLDSSEYQQKCQALLSDIRKPINT